MEPEELTSFDRLLTPQYVTAIFWVGVAASVLAGLGMLLAGGAGVPFGLAVLVGGPILTRVGCELLVLAFKVVDWVAEINTTLSQHQKQFTEQAQRARQRPSRFNESEVSSPDAASQQTTSSTGEPTLPSSQ